jgi:hypothetical protein
LKHQPGYGLGCERYYWARPRNISQPPARVLQISSPGGWDEFITDMFAAGPSLRTSDGRMDLAKVNVIGEPYGMRYTNTTMAMPDA